MKTIVFLILAILALFTVTVFAEIPSGNYKITFDGQQLSGTLMLQPIPSASPADWYFIDDSGNIVASGTRATMNQINYKGEKLFDVNSYGFGMIGDKAIILTPTE